MRKRKLQIFLSSTYEDLIDERLAAMEAILAAGHIPAAMEQFSPGDETALERIQVWIEESDAFILILGGRYGSIEPTSGKSYVELEYEYAVQKKKPFFAIVIRDEHHEQRVREFGLKVDERQHQDKYKDFKTTVAQKLCAYWNDRKDIKTAVLHKLPEWAQRTDLVGWVRADEVASPEVLNELARLSRENSELRAKASIDAESFAGVSFDELVRVLKQISVSEQEATDVLHELEIVAETNGKMITDLLLLFDAIYDKAATSVDVHEDHSPVTALLMRKMVGFGLLEETDIGTVLLKSGRVRMYSYSVTQTGLRLRTRLRARLSSI